MRWKDLIALVRDTAWSWLEPHTFQLGAALAFYGAFALAPTLIIAIALAGIFFGEDAAQGRLDAKLTGALGPGMAGALAETMTYVYVTGSGCIATVIGFGLILFASTGLFIQLQLALNQIWGVQPKPGRGFWNMVRSRFLAFVLVLGVGALLVLAVIANTTLIALHAFLPEAAWPDEPFLWDGVNWILSIVLFTLLVAMIYKLLPDAIIAWGTVCVGASLTALLFALGNFLFGQYLVRAAPASVYGSASSLVVVMLWIYYSSQILLFGAEFTKHFAKKYGKPMRPAEYAMCRPG
jgi:membrane protein